MSTVARKDRRASARGSRIRADVRLTAGGGYSRYFPAWPRVGEWLASPEYLNESHDVTSIRLVHLDGQKGTTPHPAGDSTPEAPRGRIPSENT